MYDIVGDIHGHADKLEHLLDKMGYKKQAGVWRHPSRILVSVGDLIDRGDHQRASVDIIRAMQETDNALVIMGNHEFNAIAWSMVDSKGEPLRKHNDKNRKQHEQFLREKDHDAMWYSETIEWFKSLPFYLELEGVNIVHACWQQQALDDLTHYQNHYGVQSDLFWQLANQKNHQLYCAVETLCKGWEIELPENYSFKDEEQNDRRHLRTRWWLDSVTNYADVAIDKNHVKECGHMPLEAGVIPGYRHDKPLFFGHYWLQGIPTLQTPKIACVDWSVAQGGRLVAYRYDGEQQLTDSNFVSVGP